MDAPDELVDAVAEVLWNGDSEPFIRWANLAEPVKEMQRDSARRVLALPGIADAFYAADEGEVYATALGLACSDGWSDGESAMESYIETARDHVATLRAVDDSDIMPASEFDGPVVL